MANKTSQHILITSVNLLGFCLFVFTSLHLSNKTEDTFIDDTKPEGKNLGNEKASFVLVIIFAIVIAIGQLNKIWIKN